MHQRHRRQLTVLAIFIAILAALAFATYAFFPLSQLAVGQNLPPPPDLPGWLMGLGNAGLVVVIYSLAGLGGYWFAVKLGLPGIFREAAGLRNWVLWPLFAGIAAGVILVALDRIFAAWAGTPNLPHPPFPFSLVASAAAAIGEEILFRTFVLGLWAFLLNLVLRRWQATTMALWIANIIAALAFSAAHLPAVMFMFNVSSPAALPPALLAEIFLLNSLLGLVAGERFLRDGLVAAIGVHFWADMVWHVIWPLL